MAIESITSQSSITGQRLRLASGTFRTPPPASGFVGGGHTAVSVVQPGDGYDVDPFLSLMDDRLDFDGPRSIGAPHPHAGLETVSFVIAGSAHDRDEGDIAAGDVQWMSAGRGIIHNESVQADGYLRVLQLWIALPASERDSEPDYELVHPDEAPVVRGPGFAARLYSGESNGLRASTRNRAPITMLDITLEPDATFRHDMPIDYNGFAYVLDGTALVGGAMASASEVVLIGPAPGTDLQFSAGSGGARLALYTGRPNREPVLVHGPFVAGSTDEIAEYARRYQAGQFTRMSALAATLRAGALRPTDSTTTNEQENNMTDTTALALPVGTYALDVYHSSVHFQIKHLGLSNVRGTFKSFTATLVVGETLADVAVEASIDLASIDTGQPDRDAHLLTSDFFDADRNPTMAFKSTTITQVDPDRYDMIGDLSINGHTHPATFRTEFNGTEVNPADQSVHVGFTASGEVRRGDFGIDFNMPLGVDRLAVGDKVRVDLDIQFVAPATPTE